MVYICSENPKVGGFPLPLESKTNLYFDCHFDNPNPN